MAEFLGDLTVYAGVLLAIYGLLLLHRSARDAPAPYLKAAGWLAVLVGLGGAICTGSYMVRYHAQGDFDTAYPSLLMRPMMDMSMMRGQGMMGRQMTGGSTAPSTPPAGVSDEQHREHHPESSP